MSSFCTSVLVHVPTTLGRSELGAVLVLVHRAVHTWFTGEIHTKVEKNPAAQINTGPGAGSTDIILVLVNQSACAVCAPMIQGKLEDLVQALRRLLSDRDLADMPICVALAGQTLAAAVASA
jgi:hypothetical protein